MNAVRLHRKLESETLHLPELKPFLGKMVEIIVVEEPAAAVRGEEDRGCFADLSPAKPLDDKEAKALRALLTKEQFEALTDIVAQGGPDVDAIARMRAKSMT